MIDNEALVELFDRYVRLPGEPVEHVTTWPGSLGAVVQTDGRLLSVRVDPEYLRVGQEPWVAAVVVVAREDGPGHGQPETHTILLDTAGPQYHLNDPAAVAALGARVGTDLVPDAFAEILVAYQPWSMARGELVRTAGHLAARFGITGGPEVVGPPVEVAAPGGSALEFFSTAVYGPVPGAPLHCDVYRWRVELPRGGPARWNRELLAAKLPVPLPVRG